MSQSDSLDIIRLSSKKFLAGCVLLAAILGILGHHTPWPSWLVASEVFLTVISLFIFGSIRYQLDKNALVYGMALVISATTWGLWWPTSALKSDLAAQGLSALWPFIRHHFMTIHGLEKLVHIDTMLFILGLTFFVAVIAQTRLLETISGIILEKNKGRILPTVALLALLVAASSGILDGVSMIGLMIRTLVIILILGRTDKEGLIFAVIVSTVITTVSGMWLAYGEPPNLIMKTNLFPYLDDAFFLRYCLPVAVGSYLVVLWGLRQRLKGHRVDLSQQDVLDVNVADLRFMQALRHGDVVTPLEAIEEHAELMGNSFEPAREKILQGDTLGLALVRANVPPEVRGEILSHYTEESIAAALDDHYVKLNQDPIRDHRKVGLPRPESLVQIVSMRRRVQLIGSLAFIPFIGLLVTHAMNHHVPLFIASITGFAFAFLGIINIPNIRRLALKEAVHEYKEYLFLFPLFFSITLLQKTGFFDVLVQLIDTGIKALGASHVAYIQFLGAIFLSAILDNNVVADFASKALHGLDTATLHLFAMAQIAGYAIGGTWTHIGCAQSVVAFAFIRKEIDPQFTPFQWIKMMTKIVVALIVMATVIIYVMGSLKSILH